jgi:alpha-N-arabinofuranosidase
MNQSTDIADIIVFAGKTLGTVHDRLFGQFIEMTGRCINGGLYDPTSAHARADGLRADVVEALREERPGYLRYPGGCAASYFEWQDLVGPVAARPRARLFRGHGGQAQSTAFGIPEAWALCQELGSELYLCVNANTQSPEDAANLVEYLNSKQPTRYADLRRSHGREAPYGVKYFGLGNEIYGSWQAGQKTAADYAVWCAEAIRQMKAVDPGIHVVVCGLGRPDPEWDRIVMFRLIGLADSISMHNYFGRPVFADLMAASRICEMMFRGVNQVIDEAMDLPLGVSTRVHRDLGGLPVVTRRPGIAFDEWNLWYRAPHAPVHDVEEIFHYADALAAASLMHVILRNADAVDLANISLAVNALGPIFTEGDRMVRQTIWYAHKLIRDAHVGRMVETVVDAPVFKAKHERFFCGIVDIEKAKNEHLPTLEHFDDIPAVDAAVSIDEAGRKMTLSIVQKLETRPLTVRLDLRGVALKGKTMTVHRLTNDGGLWSENTIARPDRVGIATTTEPLTTTLTLPPASLTVIEYAI